MSNVQQLLQHRFQLQHNPPQYPANVQPTPPPTQQQSKPPPQTETETNKTCKKRLAKRESSSTSNRNASDKTLQRWITVEEELLSSCFIAVFEDPKVGRDQKEESFWGKFPKVIYKLCIRLGKSGENEVDVLNRAKKAFKKEFNERSFTQEGPWEVFQKYVKLDVAEPVDPAPVEGGHSELFGEDPRPRPSGRAC
ncbi:hypothetical protein Tco_1289190 [Tanacetum coccineum]